MAYAYISLTWFIILTNTGTFSNRGLRYLPVSVDESEKNENNFYRMSQLYTPVWKGVFPLNTAIAVDFMIILNTVINQSSKNMSVGLFYLIVSFVVSSS